jgi:three-Cys-motif partner protein
MQKRRNDITYLDKRLKILKWDAHDKLINEVAEKGGSVSNEFREWTPLKLCGLSYFAGGYASILAGLKRKLPNLDVLYIDLFSGSGINRIDDVIIAGSPLACIDSATSRNVTFDTMYFNDSNPEYCTALQERLEFLSGINPFRWIGGKYHILNKDCNEALEEIVECLKQRKFVNYLAFIDPYKWEISWSSLEKLLSIEYGDVMITLQALLVAKEIGKYLKSKPLSLGETIKRFLGEEDESILEGLGTELALKDYYIEKVREYREFVVDIKIRSGSGSYEYFLIFASRKANPPWASYITKMKNFVESFSGDLVNASLEYLTGKTQRLTF